jgi:hypothetical protein
MAERTGSWDGGYIHKDARGRDVYVIRQQVNGKRYEVSTRTFSIRAALEQLKRFQGDPQGYDPRGEVGSAPIYLDLEQAKQYLAYSRNERQNTRAWVTKQRAILSWWAEQLKGIDLRGASVRDSILPALDRAAGKAHKVAVLKALYTWLRRERREITLAEDATAGGGLTMPLPRKQHGSGPKAVPREHVELAREHLVGGWVDALDLQSATGWHVTEVQRFTTAGEIEPPTAAQKAHGIAAVLVVEHKSGDQHRTAVDAKTLAAAKRLRERGGFAISWYHRAVKSACKAAGIKPFGPGVMRHSVATWAVNAGADLAAVSTFLGHRSSRTTKKFYATHATPRNPMIIPVAATPKSKRRKGDPGASASGHRRR